MPSIQVNHLSVSIKRKKIIHELNLDFAANKITAIIGPNGCGKSTLLKTISGLIKPTGGNILLDGQSIDKLKPAEIARLITFLMQAPEVSDDLSVYDLVSFGRYCHHDWRGLQRQDKEKMSWAMEQVDLSAMGCQMLSSLSGGQRQRAWLAMALAQDSPIIILDEPTTFLDIRHQLEILLLLQKMNKQAGKTIIMVLHDIQQALLFADNIVVMDQGKVICHEEVTQIDDMQVFEQVFGVKIKVYSELHQQKIISIHKLANYV